MAGFNLIDNSTRILQKSLDLRGQRQEVIASNIANAETPGYARRTFEFEKRLQNAMKSPQLTAASDNPKHIPLGGTTISQVQGEIKTHRGSRDIGDGNSVVVEDEMLALSKNEILYEAGAKLIKRKLQMLKYAANDGR